MQYLKTFESISVLFFQLYFLHYFHFQASHDVHASIIQDIFISLINVTARKKCNMKHLSHEKQTLKLHGFFE
jgi:hypothetical protein